MKIAKSLLMGIGSVVLAGLILALLAPKATRAIAATAVQVVNTAAAPLPIYDVDAPGRHVFQQECSSTTVEGCTLSPVVPSGMVFVVQSFHNFWDPGTIYNPNIQLLNTVATFPTHLTLTTNGTGAGALKGSFLYPTAKVTHNFYGAFISPALGGFGYFLDTNSQTGWFQITQQ